MMRLNDTSRKMQTIRSKGQNTTKYCVQQIESALVLAVPDQIVCTALPFKRSHVFSFTHSSVTVIQLSQPCIFSGVEGQWKNIAQYTFSILRDIRIQTLHGFLPFVGIF